MSNCPDISCLLFPDRTKEHFFSPSYLRKATNIGEMPFCAQGFFGSFLDFTNFPYSKNIYQELTLKYHEN